MAQAEPWAHRGLGHHSLYLCECLKFSLIKYFKTSLDHSHDKLPSVVLNVWYHLEVISLKVFFF